MINNEIASNDSKRMINITALKGILDSNTYVLELDNICIVIDAGAPLAKLLKALGHRTPIAIFITHEHFDHVNYLSEYIDAFGCPIYCHPAALEELRTGEFHSLIEAVSGHTLKLPESTQGFRSLSDNQTIMNIQPFVIKAIFSPGHSEGSVVYLINDNLFSGDVLFRTSIGRTDFMVDGEELMQGTLRRLQKVKFKMMYNGHSEPCTYETQQENIKKHLIEN